MNHWRKAFTLVELMVVIGITGILAGLLLPTLCKAKAQSRSAACSSNLRQIGFGLSMYVGDFHQYPTDTKWMGTALPWYTNQSLMPYAADQRKIFFCPAHRLTDRPIADSRYFNPSSYGYNSLGSGRWAGARLGLGFSSDGPISETWVRVPSDMIAFGDSGTDTAWDLRLNPNVETQPERGDNQTTSNSWLPSDRHRGGANILFCDGHVEYANQRQWIEKTDRARRRWNNDHEPHPETW
jgi:prepilin-type processing-associated H-X9-DG protein/prepilin-type N-terminal cleavage/methylation domain-containing protein